MTTNFSTEPSPGLPVAATAATMEDASAAVVVESCVPPGFRFHPTEEELVGYYLARKVSSLKIDLDVIREVDLYRIEPWDLRERCRHGNEEQSEWYFFSYKDRKYPSGTRTNRATAAGFWKATGRDKPVLSRSRVIGMRKTLVFYKGRAPHGRKSDWIIHEYRLQTSETGPPQEEGWVVCRAFQKPTPAQRPCFTDNCAAYFSTNTAALHHGSSYDHDGLLLESPPTMSTNCMQSTPSNFSSDHERQQSIGGLIADAHRMLDIIPPMESPSLSAKEGSSNALVGRRHDDEDDQIDKGMMSGADGGAALHHQFMDWKVLDKLLLSSSQFHDNNSSSNYPNVADHHHGQAVDYGGGDHHDDEDDQSQAEHFLSLFDRE